MESQVSIPKIKLETSWLSRLEPEFHKTYMVSLREYLKSQYKAGRKIFPAKDNYFSAFNLTAFDKVKVVILGQDPYHGAGQAHGLSFSVPVGQKIPPSLMNIYKELKSDLQITPARHGNLESWARQGVLLLNSVLTVEEGLAAAHQGKGWETFTDQVVRELNEQREHLVFILWGSNAQKKADFVDRKKHFVIESPHPSPLSAHRGFLGSKPFSRTNDYLRQQGLAPINWSLPESGL